MTPETDAAMTLSARIESAMRDAMRARDEQRTQTLRMAMAAAHNLKIAQGRSSALVASTRINSRDQR